ncbi:Flp pilus assembly protein TadG [Pseudaminobacter salicylatoxidans]|uniref:Flp pilus assembly protein TadG n=1 Tax=Pseudaminobacter salicylatoxidans TaxID=93369 RepID=A0A316CLN5_PSESE|nr:TadE/TadG family type IV pilus assembly protein [Pseudaminobacter salicylatoxidans]PWJ80936.1 Flp pilus assembly protein TadG [Pseudaminobacter salicylatoxidans]
MLCLFLRDRNGAAAIEFAALAIPFFLLTFAILESCISLTAGQIVSNSADEIARQFRTGQLRPDPKDTNNQKLAEKIRTMVCSNLEIMVSKGCPGLEMDLRTFTNFTDAANLRTRLTADRDLDTSDFAIKPGGPEERNILRIYYKWPVITDFMRASMSNIKGGYILQTGTAIWQNEPFQPLAAG